MATEGGGRGELHSSTVPPPAADVKCKEKKACFHIIFWPETGKVYLLCSLMLLDQLLNDIMIAEIVTLPRQNAVTVPSNPNPSKISGF